MQLDPELVRHESPPSLDPRPRVGESLGERGAQRRIGQRDAVLEVRGEVVSPGGGDASTWNAMPERSSTVEPAEIGEFTHSSR